MQKIIPFKKEILFKNTIEEITSIGIDRELKIDDLVLSGTFTISGGYKYVGGQESFDFEIPYSCYLEENYDTTSATVDIEDFYYETIEPNKLAINIELKVDHLASKPLLETNEIEAIVEEKEEEESRIDITDTPLFEQTESTHEDYVTYKIYIVREGDTIQSILEKYEITSEQLLKYNVINDLIPGDKIIIPHEKNK